MLVGHESLSFKKVGLGSIKFWEPLARCQDINIPKYLQQNLVNASVTNDKGIYISKQL